MVEDTIFSAFASVGYTIVDQYEYYEEVKTDNCNANTSRVLNASGNWNNSANAGTFHVNTNTTSNANTNIGSHLKCLTIPNKKSGCQMSSKDKLQRWLNDSYITLPLGKT